MVETLVALAVTSLLAVAVVGWTVSTAQVAAGAERKARASSTAESVLRLIANEIACGDFPPPPDRARSGIGGTAQRDENDAHVRVENGALVLRGRRTESASGAVRRYTLDARRNAIVATDLPAERGGSSQREPARTVAEGVKEFTLAEEGARNRPRRLAVTIALHGGEPLTRRFALP